VKEQSLTIAFSGEPIPKTKSSTLSTTSGAGGAILPSPPTGGDGAVNRSPARQLAGLRLESR
jgi:hypothetical protein